LELRDPRCLTYSSRLSIEYPPVVIAWLVEAPSFGVFLLCDQVCKNNILSSFWHDCVSSKTSSFTFGICSQEEAQYVVQSCAYCCHEWQKIYKFFVKFATIMSPRS
jgi:hypothetical protein